MLSLRRRIGLWRLATDDYYKVNDNVHIADFFKTAPRNGAMN